MTKDAAEPAVPEFNRMVLATLAAYPTDGTHDYYWPRNGESNYDGVSRDLTLDGKTVMKGEPGKRTFCCGLTLEVFLEAYKEWVAKNPGSKSSHLTPAKWPEFQKLWFVLDKNGPGPSLALEKFKLGKTIKQSEALPGDFVQLWRRSGSGHSVIFIDWVRGADGIIDGFKYWSTQTSTKGIHETIELFAPEGGKGVAAEYTYWARVTLEP